MTSLEERATARLLDDFRLFDFIHKSRGVGRKCAYIFSRHDQTDEEGKQADQEELE